MKEAEKPTDNPQRCQKAPQGINHLLSQQCPGLYGAGLPLCRGSGTPPGRPMALALHLPSLCFPRESLPLSSWTGKIQPKRPLVLGAFEFL